MVVKWQGPKGESIFLGPGSQCPGCKVYKGQYHSDLCKIGYPKEAENQDRDTETSCLCKDDAPSKK